MSDSDFSLRLPVPVIARPRRPLSIRASTASCSMRFSLRTMISGAPSSSNRLRRVEQVDAGQQVVDRLRADARLEDLAELLCELAELLIREELLDVERVELGLGRLDVAREALGILLQLVAEGSGLPLEVLTPLGDLLVGLALQLLLALLGRGLDLVDLLLDLLGQLAGQLVLEKRALLDDDLLVATFADREVGRGLLSLLGLDLLDEFLGTRGHRVDGFVERLLQPLDLRLGVFLLGLDPLVQILLQLLDRGVALLLELDHPVVVLG